MRAIDVNGTGFEITRAEEERIAHMFMQKQGEKHVEPHGSPQFYAERTRAIMKAAQKELREATGDYPENLNELYEFAAKHELFGDREETHIMCNFLKVFYCLMQRESHMEGE